MTDIADRTTDVDLLRRAAALMRQRALAARPGPYAVHVEPGDEYNEFWLMDPAGRPVAGCAHRGLEADPAANSAHLASWHPAVALAIGHWLSREVSRQEHLERYWEDALPPPVIADELAIAVARAYLGEDPPGDA